MADSFHDMSKINELSAELIVYLKRYNEYLSGDLSYTAYDEIGWRRQEYIEKGYDSDTAGDLASRDLEEYYFEHGEPYADEFKTIRRALEVLNKLTAKEEAKEGK